MIPDVAAAEALSIMDSEIEAVPVHRAGSETRERACDGLRCRRSGVRSRPVLCGSVNNSDQRRVDLHPHARQPGSPAPSFSRHVRRFPAWPAAQAGSVLLL